MSDYQVTIDHAYREACLALGEATVQQRLLIQRVAMLEAGRAPDEPPVTATPNE